MIDPYSTEADELLERHQREALDVQRIKAERLKAERRAYTANRMSRKLATVAQDLYDFDRRSEEIEEEMEGLSAAMQEDRLTAAQRRDIWAWVAVADEQWGWG